MRIAFFHELGIGGARRAVNELSYELKKQHNVDLFFVDEEYFGNEDIFFNNTNYFKFKSKAWKGGNWKVKIYKDTTELFQLYKLHKLISSKINRGNYDLVIVNPSKYTQSPFLLRFVKSKKIYYCQETLRIVYEPFLKINKNIGLIKFYYESLNRFFRKYIDLSNVKKADLILTNSNNTKNNIKKNYNLLSLVSYLGVDTDFFKPAKIKKDIDILFVGSEEFTDGFDLLKDALKSIKHKINLETTVGKRRKDIDDKTLRDLYRRAKIVICTARDEPFGMIPLEAMAVGDVVIAVNEGGYRESIIDKTSGFLVERNDAKLARKIDWVLDNPKKAEEIGRNARQIIVVDWNWKKRAKELEIKIIDFLK